VFSIPGGGSVHDIAFLGADLAVLLRQTSADGDLVGIHRLDTSSGALTPLVAPVPAVQWFGDAGYCEPSLICGSFGTLGCSFDEAACASGGPPPCLVYYAKVDPDRPSRMAAYVYDVNAATASMLSGPAPDRLFVEARRVRALVWGATGFARTLDICSGVERECPLSPGQAVVWRPDGRAFVTFGRGSSTGVMNVADGTCSVPLAGEADAVAYAPDSAHLSLVVDDPGAMTQTMWLADGDGQSPIAVARGTWLRGRFSPDSRLLYVTHYDSTTGLGWVDVAAPETPERILASNAGTIGVRGNRRALFVDHYNGQDGTGDLVLVDLSTGAQQLLARAVTGVAARGSTSEVDEEGTDVAYSVRGRASSARDGLWLMTLPP
jgi:hypothetical protein